MKKLLLILLCLPLIGFGQKKSKRQKKHEKVQKLRVKRENTKIQNAVYPKDKRGGIYKSPNKLYGRIKFTKKNESNSIDVKFVNYGEDLVIHLIHNQKENKININEWLIVNDNEDYRLRISNSPSAIKVKIINNDTIIPERVNVRNLISYSAESLKNSLSYYVSPFHQSLISDTEIIKNLGLARIFSGIGFNNFGNGKISSEDSYANGLRSGISRKWYRNEKLKAEVNYKRGEKDFPRKEWYENGQLSEELILITEIDKSGSYYDLEKSETYEYKLQNILKEKAYLIEKRTSLQEEYSNLTKWLVELGEDIALVNNDFNQFVSEYGIKKINKINKKYKKKNKLREKDMKIHFSYHNIKDKLDDLQSQELDVNSNLKKIMKELNIAEPKIKSLEKEAAFLEINIKNENDKPKLDLVTRFKRWHQNGQLERQGNLISGKKDGLWKNWQEDGKIDTEYHYKDDILHGRFYVYYSNGKLEKRGSYLKGKRDSIWEWWYESSEKLQAVKHYKDNEFHGLLSGYYENGSLEVEGNYINGKRDGLWQWWHENGRIYCKTEHTNGEIESQTKWNEDGSKRKKPKKKYPPTSKAHAYLKSLIGKPVLIFGLYRTFRDYARSNQDMYLYLDSYPSYAWKCSGYAGPSRYDYDGYDFWLNTNDNGETFTIEFTRKY